MSRPPAVSDRSEAELFEALQSMAAAYTESWDPGSVDPVRTLLRIDARFAAGLFDRLNDAPEKHRLAFLDALGVARRPPMPARVPVTVDVSGDAVTVSEGARVLADPGTSGDTDTVAFEIESAFEATGASLTDVVAVDPDDERVVDHRGLLDGDPVRLFQGDDCRDPALYLGDDLLDPAAGTAFVLETEGEGPLFGPGTEWEYYGLDGAGVGGWHRLERRGTVDGHPRFRMPDEPIRRSVDGTETYWVRCRPGDGADPALSVEAVAVRVDAEGAEPDALVANDVPLPTGEPFRPFGRFAHPPATWYVASEAAFPTADGTAEIRLEPPTGKEENTPAGEWEGEPADVTERGGGDPTADETHPLERQQAREPGASPVFDGPPVVSWEYYSGSGWSRIEGVDDGTDALREAGTVQFPVPSDLTSTTVAGREGPWIRARLVSGSYGGATGASDSRPPRFGGVTVAHEHDPRSVSTVFRRADAAYERVDLDTGPVDPFPGVAEPDRTVYLGFDGRLVGDPITLFVAVDGPSPPSDPEFEWEFWSTSTGRWRSIDAVDGTRGLTEQGIVELPLPAATAERERFGRRRHWLRTRSTGFHPSEDSDRGANAFPRIEGLYTNAGWAEQTETVAESMGTSDGTPAQTFSCSRTPVHDPMVRVGESSEHRERLPPDRPDVVETVTGEYGESADRWVRWKAVEGFEGSGPADRHYTVDGLDGTITFGDGKRGDIPPDGEVRVTYRTGGGSTGNVGVGAVTELDCPGVEGVTNPVPATGGTDAEPTDALSERAASRFRHRGRAVTPDDYERIAAAAVRETGPVTCLPAGERSDDVTVVFAPETDAPRPAPSAALRERVAAALRTRAPARVTTDDRLTVRGPTYVPAAVDVTVRARRASVERGVVEGLERLLHPLAGNDGGGWAFGKTPDLERIESVVAGVEDVESVRDVNVRLGDDDPIPLRAGSVPPDALVCSGDHCVSVEPTVGEQGDAGASRRSGVDR